MPDRVVHDAVALAVACMRALWLDMTEQGAGSTESLFETLTADEALDLIVVLGGWSLVLVIDKARDDGTTVNAALDSFADFWRNRDQ